MGRVGRGSNAALRIILGGTFDPPTRGHIDAALAVADAFQTKVWLMPNQRSPLKHHRAVATSERLAMLQAAIGGHPELAIETIEWELPPPNATAVTLAHLTTQSPIGVVIGSDSLNTIEQWVQFDRLLELANWIVLPRAGHPIQPPDSWSGRQVDPAELMASAAGRWCVLNHQPVDTESNLIRQAIANGKPWRHWVVPAVADYIQENRLYDRHGR